MNTGSWELSLEIFNQFLLHDTPDASGFIVEAKLREVSFCVPTKRSMRGKWKFGPVQFTLKRVFFCCLPQDLKLSKETSFTIQTNYVLTARFKNIKLLSVV